MSLWKHAVGGLRRLVRGRIVDQELDDELGHWMDLTIRERMQRGLTRERAEREVRLEIGGAVQVKEHVRSAGWEANVDSVFRDIQYALRNLRASPGYALAAISTLAVGIAMTTTLLTVSNTVLRQQWPVPDPSRMLTIIAERGPGFSPTEVRYFNEHAQSFRGIFGVRCLGGVNDECQLAMNGSPAAVDFVSGNYFQLLGLGLGLGRGFVADEDRLDDPRSVAVISDALWRNRFGADPHVVGTTVRIDDVPFTIVGVAAREFTGTTTERKDAWLPLAAMLLLRPNQPAVRAQLTNPSSEFSESRLAGRLATGVTRERALAELRMLNQRFSAKNRVDDFGVRLIPTTFFPNPAKLRTAAGTFTLMFVAVVLVLLLACANVGNLLLARATARAREIAVRLALGASRGRIIRQLMTESLLLAATAGVVGVSISYVLPSVIMNRVFSSLSWHFAPDVVVIVAATGLVALTCLAFGLAPALHATRSDVSAVLKSGDGRVQRGATSGGLRGNLLAAQVAISLLLLVNAGLLVRGIQHGRNRNPGFATTDVGILTFELPGSSDSLRSIAFAQQLIQGSRNLSGVRVAFTNGAPMGSRHVAHFHLAGESVGKQHTSGVFDVSPEFVGLLGLSIVAGRNLAATDGDEAVLVNQSLAADLWPGENPLGQIVVDGTERRVVGVLKNANMYRVDRVDPIMLRPIQPRSLPVMLMRPAIPAITEAAAALATRIDSRAIVHVDSIAGNIDQQLAGLQTVAMLAAILGLIALVLAGVGVFGVFAYVVQNRTREIGIRTALGASAASVTTLVLRESSRSVIKGLAIGFLVSAGAAQVLASELYGARPFDPLVFGGAALLVGVAGVAAAYVPARRAARVDPAMALRNA
ncbi:MAG: ADOP family duplicated permease [bacterium]